MSQPFFQKTPPQVYLSPNKPQTPLWAQKGLKSEKSALNRKKTTLSEAQQQQDKQGFLMFFNQNKFKKHKNQKPSLAFDEKKSFRE